MRPWLAVLGSACKRRSVAEVMGAPDLPFLFISCLAFIPPSHCRSGCCPSTKASWRRVRGRTSLPAPARHQAARRRRRRQRARARRANRAADGAVRTAQPQSQVHPVLRCPAVSLDACCLTSAACSCLFAALPCCLTPAVSCTFALHSHPCNIDQSIGSGATTGVEAQESHSLALVHLCPIFISLRVPLRLRLLRCTCMCRCGACAAAAAGYCCRCWCGGSFLRPASSPPLPAAAPPPVQPPSPPLHAWAGTGVQECSNVAVVEPAELGQPTQWVATDWHAS